VLERVLRLGDVGAEEVCLGVAFFAAAFLFAVAVFVAFAAFFGGILFYANILL
jgi:hypothetical protein